jgi:hypothetical protein
MNRITPEMVLRAYEEQEMIPIQDEWTDMQEGMKCGCALAAVFTSQVDEGFEMIGRTHDVENLMVGELKLDPFYIRGFIYGFDGSGECPIHASIEGYDDGRKAWEAVKHLAE